VPKLEFFSTVEAAVPEAVWLVGAAALLMTAGLGFGAGVYCARNAPKWALQRARKNITQLFQMTVQSLESAHEVCLLLEQFPNLQLSAAQVERLEAQQNRLLESIAGSLERQQVLAELVAGEQERKAERTRKPEELRIDWLKVPEDRKTGLPDRAAFEANLSLLLELGSQAEAESGLLLVKVDKLNHLRARFGAAGADHFLKKMTSIVCRSMRDDDLACLYSDDTIAVLFPAVSHTAGRQLAETIRNTIRHYHFRLDESGPEVLVTASLGYSPCLPTDNADLVVNRAGDALSKSQRRGRNQLHVHDGQALVHCQAGC
jgi:diguanylate cyclase (GGDEF)-like protein